MVDKDCNYSKNISSSNQSRRFLHTLHPTLPFVCLITVEETQILVSSLDGHETSHQRAEAKNPKCPCVELLLFLQPEVASICEVDEGERYTNYHR